MDFYSSISRYYDEIFPLNASQVKFIESCFEPPYHNINILDAGCGTGALDIELAGKGFNVHAIDYEPRMIDNAKKKKRNLGLTGSPIFDEADMRFISQKFIPGSFNAVISFGNTLVHLLDDNDVITFFEGTRRVLKENGCFLMQVLNYDYILDKKIVMLPVIENENILFERFYDFRGNKYLDFITRLTVKKEDRVFHNQIRLNPLRKSKIEEFLHKAGFKDIAFFGDFVKGPAGGDSLPLVTTAKK
jgi:ubiquinone/menaquinone biosynthesis C-methylase UbiE